MSHDDGLTRGFHGIPDDHRLAAMTFAELAEQLSLCDKDTPKYLVVERELKAHLAKDQARANRENVLIGAGIGLLSGLAGVILGWWLRST